MLFISKFLLAHEDQYYAFNESNLQIKVQVGYDNTLELPIIRAYAPAINDFIKEIAPSEKVLIQFEEDYCYFNNYHTYLSYGKFKEFIVPAGFPFLYDYDMNFINDNSGLSIIISEKYFKIEPVLKLIEYGLRNINKVKDNQNRVIDISIPFAPGTSKKDSIETRKYYPIRKFNVISSILATNILESKPSELQKKYMSKPRRIRIPMACEAIRFYLKNNSVAITSIDGEVILSIPTLNAVHLETRSCGYFIFDTNHSFYFIDKSLKTNKKKYNLSSPMNCLSRINFFFEEDKGQYRIERNLMQSFDYEKDLQILEYTPLGELKRIKN